MLSQAAAPAQVLRTAAERRRIRSVRAAQADRAASEQASPPLVRGLRSSISAHRSTSAAETEALSRFALGAPFAPG